MLTPRTPATGSVPAWDFRSDLRQIFGSRVSGQDLAIATRQLATLIGAGIGWLSPMILRIEFAPE